MEDMLEQTNEIMDVLGKPYGLPDDVDEDDLEAGKSSIHPHTRTHTQSSMYLGLFHTMIPIFSFHTQNWKLLVMTF